MVRLSVNVNKIATLRNARGGSIPNLVRMSRDIESYGAQGITVHPRPDERHIRYSDVHDLKGVVQTEFNIEGYPNRKFLDLCLEVKPEQVTLVPDAPEVLTSNAGWDTIAHQSMLQEIVSELKEAGMRVSIFLDPNPELAHAAKATGADRCELYTEAYASGFEKDKDEAIEMFVRTAEVLNSVGLGINAGHDLNLSNLRFFAERIPELEEVSIGHALISDALYFGLENVVQMYLHQLDLS